MKGKAAVRADATPSLRRSLGADAIASAASADGPLRALFDEAVAPRASEAEIDGYRCTLPRDAGTLLQAFVGHGRLLLPLQDAGFVVHGVDPSGARLARCAARLEATGGRAELFRQALPALNLPFRYAAALFGAGDFQRLARGADALDALLRIRAHLVDPGWLHLDLLVPGEASHPPGAPMVELASATMPDGARIVRRSETAVDGGRRLMIAKTRFERRDPGGIRTREDEVRETTWYTPDEIATLVGDAGYRDVRCQPPPWHPASAGAHAARFVLTARI